MAKFKGYLDRLRESLEILDEQIENARRMSKVKNGDDRAAGSESLLHWAKTLRDLVEVRNDTLTNIKAHLLGRGVTGAVVEPANYYGGNKEVMFERDFQNFLSPWTRQDLELECEDCGVSSDRASTRRFPSLYENFQEVKPEENVDLCDQCYERRVAQNSANGKSPQDSRNAGSG